MTCFQCGKEIQSWNCISVCSDCVNKGMDKKCEIKQSVFVLTRICKCGDDKILGIYGTREKAEEIAVGLKGRDVFRYTISEWIIE